MEPPDDLIDRLLARHLAIWEDDPGEDLLRMRWSNPEWDFMGRTFLVLALANLALRGREPQRMIRAIDGILADTLAAEAEHGMYWFLMDYARAKPWVLQPERSIFLDGEIALMLGARLLLSPHRAFQAVHTQRIHRVMAQMESGTLLSGESYPDECWTFCNTIGLAAIRLSDAVHNEHTDLPDRWLAAARDHLIEPSTGLLVSSYREDGTWLDGPEGSSIWMAAHCLQMVDPQFAADQYRRGRDELVQRTLGFGWVREWPGSWKGPADIDSGPIVPLLGASAGSSGLAFVGAAAFDDSITLDSLLASLELAAFPIDRGDQRRYAAGNQVGDAVVLYSLVLGPLWEEAWSRVA